MTFTPLSRARLTRRHILQGSALGAVALASTGFERRALAADQVDMRVAGVVTSDSTLYVGTDMMNKELTSQFPNSFKMTVHKGTLDKGERELYEALQIGTLDAVLATTGPLSSFVPEADLFNLPFLFKNKEHAFAAVDGEIGDWFNKKMIDKGFRILGWWTTGARNTSNNVSPIHKPSDYQGMKIRVMESPPFIAFYKAMGAKPVPMPINEVYTALQQGTIGGIDGSLPAQLEFKHIEVLKYAAITNHVVLFFPLTVSESWWQSLPQDVRDAITAAERKARKAQRAAAKAYNEKVIGIWKKQGKIITRPAIEPFRAIAQKTNPQFYEKIGGKEIIDKINELGKQF